MPKYSYHCEKCNITYDKIHLMSEIHSVCDKCGEENSLNKIPTFFNMSKKINKKSKPGDLVNSTIEDSRRDIEEYKESLKGREYDN